MPARSTAFSSFDAQPWSNAGINGALTPARPHRQHQHDHQQHHHRRKNTNDIYTAGSTTAYPNAIERPNQTPSRLRLGERSSGRSTSGVGGEGISLQETEARIGDLERREFDLKLKLFYMEEQLEQAAGGADALQLHKEVMDAKLHRAHAEEAAGAAEAALTGMEVKCRELEMQVRDVEAQRAKDRGKWAMADGERESRMKKHTLLLEAALRTERAENARLRLESAKRRASWDSPVRDSPVRDGNDQAQEGQGQRRRSTGEAADPSRGNSGTIDALGREHREQQLAARVRSQDSSLGLLRADVTTLRRQLRKQREENDAVRTAAEQVAYVEAEEIARLAVDLEGAVRASNAEAERRRQAEDRLEAAQKRLLHLATGASAGGGSPTPRTGCKTLSPRRNGIAGRGRAQKVAGGVRGDSVGPLAAGTSRGKAPAASCEREAASTPPTRSALGSTIASRARSTRDGPANRRKVCGEGGTGRFLGSPRRAQREAEMKDKKRPWGSSPPPSPRRELRPPGGTAGASPTQGAGYARPLPRQSDEKVWGVAGGGGRTAVRHDVDPALDRGRTWPCEKLQEASIQRGRHPPGRGKEAGAFADGLGEYLARERTDVPEAPDGEDVVTGSAAAAGWCRSGDVGQDTPASGPSYLGVDLTATIARELRAAVATTPSSTLSPGSINFNRGGVGGGGGGDKRTDVRKGRGEERQDEPFGSVLEGGGDLLRSIRRGGSKHAWDGGNPGVGESGRGSNSREVAELELDVQHIFHFFAAKDGRKRSGLPSKAAVGKTDVIADIAKALS
ncbi:unnamed protein product [Scytosiphon promiscuus]